MYIYKNIRKNPQSNHHFFYAFLFTKLIDVVSKRFIFTSFELSMQLISGYCRYINLIRLSMHRRDVFVTVKCVGDRET